MCAQQLWEKWGLDSCSYMKRFSFDEFFSKHQVVPLEATRLSGCTVCTALPQRVARCINCVCLTCEAAAAPPASCIAD